MTATTSTLSALRARRLARKLIELDDQLGEIELGLAPRAGADPAAIATERDRVIARLERATARLERSDPLRAAIELAIGAHRSAPERVPAALLEMREAMRRSSPPPPITSALRDADG